VKPYVAAGRKNRLRYDELFDVSNVELDGTVVDPASPRAEANKGNGLFHVDSSFNPRRAGFSLLLSHELPPRDCGGATAFADTRAAYEDLSEDMKRRLLENNYVAGHSMHHSRKVASPEFFAHVNPRDYPFGRHYILQRHERSGRMNLYLAAHIHHIEGLEPAESEALFDKLYSHAQQAKYVVEVQWNQPGDLVIWDNTAVMHRAVGGAFQTKYRRDMRRATVHDDSSQAWGLNEHSSVRQGLP
jgi:alpha-ketoglutarate-dependent 2,4-dichlorophenoxyacetate dioxygenase